MQILMSCRCENQHNGLVFYEKILRRIALVFRIGLISLNFYLPLYPGWFESINTNDTVKVYQQ